METHINGGALPPWATWWPPEMLSKIKPDILPRVLQFRSRSKNVQNWFLHCTTPPWFNADSREKKMWFWCFSFNFSSETSYFWIWQDWKVISYQNIKIFQNKRVQNFDVKYLYCKIITRFISILFKYLTKKTVFSCVKSDLFLKWPEPKIMAQIFCIFPQK